MSFNIRKSYQIIDIIGRIEEPNRRAIKELEEVLTFNRCKLFIFFSIECTKVDLVIVSVARISRSLELSHAPLCFILNMKQHYFLQKYTSKTFLNINIFEKKSCPIYQYKSIHMQMHMYIYLFNYRVNNKYHYFFTKVAYFCHPPPLM